MRILVVEDEVLIALALERVLTEAGHRVIGMAADAAEALALVAGERPELALVDIILRGQDDGIALARMLKERWSIPSLFMSGQVPEARLAQDAALGLINKPFDPYEVSNGVAVVAALLEGQIPNRVPSYLELFTKDP